MCSQNLESEKSIFRQFSYSQDGEDIVLSAYYEDKEYIGFYVDIGAMHPFRFSNTQFFFERGWRGMNIDANPATMSKFFTHRPKDINLEFAISDKEEEIPFYIFQEPALSTLSAERAKLLMEKGWELKCVNIVKAMPVNEMLDKYLPKNQRIDFISIDIESLELKVILNFDFDKFSPDFFLVEELSQFDCDYISCGQSDVHRVLFSKGYYAVAKTRRTVVYGRKCFLQKS